MLIPAVIGGIFALSPKKEAPTPARPVATFSQFPKPEPPEATPETETETKGKTRGIIIAAIILVVLVVTYKYFSR